MNKKYISTELEKRGVYFDFFWHEDAGQALRFLYKTDKGSVYWNALLPIDDEKDAEFVNFVEANYRRLRVETGSAGT